MQLLKQPAQGHSLCLRTGITRSAALLGQSTHVSHPDGVSVMMLAVRSHHLLRSARFNRAIRRNHIMVSAPYPAQRSVIAVDVRQAKGTARPIGGAVHNNQRDSSHAVRTVAKLRHQQPQSVPTQ